MRLIRYWYLDLLAVVALVAYGWTIRYTARGAADPVWTAIQQRGVIRVGTDPGFKPFAEERAGRLQGYDVDLMTDLAQRLGLRVEFVPVGYDALYDALSTRRVDVLAAALPLAPEQGWRARFSSAYLNAGQVLLVRQDSGITSEAQLTDQVIGAALGTEGDTFARKLRHDHPTIRVRSDFGTANAAVDALAAGQLDAVITDAVTAIAETQRQPKLTIARALTFDPYVLAMPVAAYRLQAEVDRALDEMRRADVFARLNATWFRYELLHDNTTGQP